MKSNKNAETLNYAQVLAENKTSTLNIYNQQKLNSNLEKFELFNLTKSSNLTLDTTKSDLILPSSGILILSTKILNKQNSTLKNHEIKSKNRSLIDLKTNSIKITFLDDSKLKDEKYTKQILKMTPITNNDPLGAFSTPQLTKDQTSAQNDLYNVKKTLRL